MHRLEKHHGYAFARWRRPRNQPLRVGFCRVEQRQESRIYLKAREMQLEGAREAGREPQCSRVDGLDCREKDSLLAPVQFAYCGFGDY